MLIQVFFHFTATVDTSPPKAWLASQKGMESVI